MDIEKGPVIRQELQQNVRMIWKIFTFVVWHRANKYTNPKAVHDIEYEIQNMRYLLRAALFCCGSGCITRWRHQMETFSALLAIYTGIHRSPVNSLHKGQWRGSLMLSLVCARINGRINNLDAGDLIRHRAHYDAIVMIGSCWNHAINNHFRR